MKKTKRNFSGRMLSILGILKYIFMMPLIVSGQDHCAKNDYPEMGSNLIVSAPTKDLEGNNLDYQIWMVPLYKVQIAKNGFLVSHPKYSDECKEEASIVADDAAHSILSAMKKPAARFLVICLTIRNDVPDREWHLVFVK